MRPKLVLPLIPNFHNRHFKAVRSILLGMKVLSPDHSPVEVAAPVQRAQGLVYEAPALVLESVQAPPSTNAYTQQTIFSPQPSTVIKPNLSSHPVRRSSWLNSVMQTVATIVIILSTIMMGILFGPDLYYVFQPVKNTPIVATQQLSAIGGEFAPNNASSSAYLQFSYIPPVNKNLPEGRWLIIPRIGLRTELRETDSVDEALNKGVWMVPGYGDPGDTKQPMIVAAHRYGWEWWWKNDYWKYNSFYLLPDLEPGDMVEVIDNQQKWVYEVYAGEEGKAITDYQADLILYTCKLLNSPIRHFRYARLVDPTKNTQSATLSGSVSK